MKKYDVSPLSGEEVAKRMFYMAWLGCGGPLGMGILQDRGPQTEEEVIASAVNRSDYPGGAKINPMKAGEIDGDYVQGRMMKTTIQYEGSFVMFSENTPRPGYQGWARKYKTYDDLLTAALNTFGRVADA